jgi:hypothetical protein
MCLIIAGIFWMLRAMRVIYRIAQYWDMRQFYTTVLGIDAGRERDRREFYVPVFADALSNMTWYDVLRHLCQVSILKTCLRQFY